MLPPASSLACSEAVSPREPAPACGTAASSVAAATTATRPLSARRLPPIVRAGDRSPARIPRTGLVELRKRAYGATQRTTRTEDLTMHRRARRIRLLSFLVLGVTALVLAAGGGTASSAQAAKAKPKESVPGELLVGFQPNVSAAEQQAALKKVGASEKKKFGRIHGSLASVSPQNE